MQGFNMGRYYALDASGRPTFNNSSHPLGKRASKFSQGVLTVRFELPFAIWCNHCSPPAIVGQGVRFNAEKKKVGNHHSTPIWSFRMKHSACGGWWEIRTDPKKAEYIVVDGAKRRDYGPDDRIGETDGDFKFLTEKEKEARRNDAFANLEGKFEDSSVAIKNKERLEELYDQSEVWRNPYDVNAKLRKGFREQRKLWAKDEKQKKGIRERFSLGMEIADETDADRAHASLVEFGDNEDTQAFHDAKWNPFFQNNTCTPVNLDLHTRGSEVEVAAETSHQTLQQTLLKNTKATIDPFVLTSGKRSIPPNFRILKRKKNAAKSIELQTVANNALLDTDKDLTFKTRLLSQALVNYNSD